MPAKTRPVSLADCQGIHFIVTNSNDPRQYYLRLSYHSHGDLPQMLNCHTGKGDPTLSRTAQNFALLVLGLKPRDSLPGIEACAILALYSATFT